MPVMSIVVSQMAEQRYSGHGDDEALFTIIKGRIRTISIGCLIRFFDGDRNGIHAIAVFPIS